MPGGLVLGGWTNFADAGASTGSQGTTVTAAGAAHTKGSYSELVAATTYDAIGFILNIQSMSAQNVGNLIDIAIGAAGSEIVIVPNFNTVTGIGSIQTNSIFVPIAIPAGTRIAASMQSATASATCKVQVILLDGTATEGSYGAPTNYGALTATSLGTQIDPGGTVNTKGAWVQIAASTTYDIGALQLLFDRQSGTFTSSAVFADLGIGAAGSEQVIVPNIPMSSNSGGTMSGQCPPLIKKRIPAGTRLAMRAQNSNNGSSTRRFGVSILGYPQ